MLMLVSRDGNYMPISRTWSSVSEGGYAFYLTSTYSCVVRLSTRPFQDLNEPLRSLLSTGRPSSTLPKTCKRSCKYTSTPSPPEGDAVAISVETTLLAQELLCDRQCGVCRRPLRLLSLGSSLFFFPNCFVLSLLMGAFQMEAVTTEYLLYMH